MQQECPRFEPVKVPEAPFTFQPVGTSRSWLCDKCHDFHDYWVRRCPKDCDDQPLFGGKATCTG